MQIKIKKDTLLELIRVYRKYWKTGDTDLLDKKTNLCFALEEQTNGKIDWGDFSELVGAFTKWNLNLDNEKIIYIFEIVGIEVID